MGTIFPFTLQIDDLANLGQDRAVEFFRRLLWAEAGRVGIGRHLIDVPQCINVADGGIDALVENAQSLTDELIPSGTTGFQIKSSSLGPQACRKELHQGEKLNKPIKPEIKRILDLGGTYVLVTFADIPSRKRIEAREDAIKDELKRLRYHNAKVRVYTANQLAGWAERFPSLVTWFRNDLSQCRPYSSWAQKRDVKIPRKFVGDESRNLWMEEVRSKLRKTSDQCPIFRITGLSGIGKTRFVFEILAPNDLKHRVLYVGADQFRLSTLYNTIQNDDNLSAIIVIDECDLQQHDEFVRAFSERGARLAVFTLSYDIGKVPPPTALYNLNPLTQSALEEMLQAESPQLPKNVISRLSKFADGYPRIAILLSESYLANSSSQEDFLTISDEALMNRLISGHSNLSSEHFRQTKRVLMGLSLFRKVGYEGKLSQESRWLATFIQVPWQDFQEVVAEQKRRGIIQGQNYLYVTPFMLRVYLLREWWESLGLSEESLGEFIGSIPEQFRHDLFQRFLDHVPYIASTHRGAGFVREILQKVFSRDILQTELGASFFSKLTEADPESALASLKNTIGTWNREELLQFRTGRREVIWALEKIAVWKELFADAARLLLALGDAENETWANNASGVFVDLFSPAPAPVAPTEASPQERFPILREALYSGSRERRELALRACNQALRTQNFTRMVGAEHQGLRKEPQLWMPKTYGEWFDAYRQVWQLLRERLDDLPVDEQQQAVNILLQCARHLAPIQALAVMVIDTVNELAKAPYVDKKKILEGVIQILRYEGKELPSDIRRRWEQLRDELIGSGFSSRMKRYVALDLFEDKFDEQGNQVDQTQPRIEELAQQAIENVELLREELTWLVTAEAQNGYRFGYALGSRDRDFSLLPMLVEAQRNASGNVGASFLGGYLRALFERDQARWENQLDALVEDKELDVWIPELTWRSGMSDRAALRVLELAEKGVVSVDRLRVFGLGSVMRNLSEEVFGKWIVFLLASSNPYAVPIALELYHFYYVYKDAAHKLPEELTQQLLTHQSLFQKSETGGRNVMDEYHWVEIATAYIRLYPEKSLIIAEKMLDHFGEDGTIVDGFHSRTHAVLNEITLRYPLEVWKQVAKYLGPPIDTRAFNITSWLRGGDFFEPESQGILSSIPLERIWEWVAEDIAKRAWYLASFVPRILFREEGKVCLAREVLVRYGGRQDVQRNLMANFSTEGWTGPGSLHLENKKLRLLEFAKNETNDNVRRWVNDYILQLDRSILREKIEEEREEL